MTTNKTRSLATQFNMKPFISIPICLLFLLLTGCKRHIREADVIGPWLEVTGKVTQTNVFSPDHTYVTTWVSTKHLAVFGTWELNRNHLIVTLYSNSFAAPLTSSNDAQIELSDDTLVLKDVDEHGNDRTRTYTKVK